MEMTDKMIVEAVELNAEEIEIGMKALNWRMIKPVTVKGAK